MPNSEEAKKGFFFEKKNQKLLLFWVLVPGSGTPLRRGGGNINQLGLTR
jgi:hypothetical protein